MEHLLESTKYSDLTLTCAARSIPTHRAIVCPQSGFFDAACSGKFLVSGDGKKTWYTLLTAVQESKCQNINLEDDDVECVRKMLSFMYKGTYEDEQTELSTLQVAGQAGESSSIHSTAVENTPEDKSPYSGVVFEFMHWPTNTMSNL